VRSREKAPMIERLSSSRACVKKANAKSRLVEIMRASGRIVGETSECFKTRALEEQRVLVIIAGV
jgi:hypothetical protein